jgi:hypothetical protein
MTNESPANARRDDRASRLSVPAATGALLGGLRVFVVVLLVVIIPAIRGAPI